MQKQLLGFVIFSITSLANANTSNLVDVFQQALKSDPIWLQSISQNLADRTGVPISLASLLPTINANLTPSISKTQNSGSAINKTTGSTKGYSLNLNLKQTIFDFGKLADLNAARALSKASNATLNAASQNLIIRLSRAYFQILSDEDNITYLRSTRRAYKKQLEQTRQQYKVGLKTITDVYTAQASYESAVANLIGAKNTLATDFENLRTITGKSYHKLARLKKDFPFSSPDPAKIEKWVEQAGQYNWSIKSAQYAAIAKKSMIHKQFANNLPRLEFDSQWSNQYSHSTSQDIVGTSGTARSKSTSASLNLAVPLIAGGSVIASTRRAQYDYQVALQKLQLELRKTISQTRQNYLNVVSGISKIKADRKAIQSSISSLKGMRAGYHVGTETLVNVLNQQQNVYLAQTEYSNDRFTYINSLLALKEAAGTLSIEDLIQLNKWLKKSKSLKLLA